MPAKLDLIKKYLIDACKKSSILGISTIATTKNHLLSIFWITCLLSWTCICCYLIFISIVEYSNSPVSTLVQFINEDEVDFPVITICNRNPTVTNESINFLLNLVQDYYSLQKPLLMKDLDFINEYLNSDSTLTNYINFYWENLNNSQKQSLGYPLKDMVIKCQFKNEKCDMDLDFKWYFSYRNGNCWMYNFNNTKKVKSAVEDNHLELELFSGYEEDQPSFYQDYGFAISITNFTDFAEVFDWYIPKIQIPTSRSVQIQVSRSFIDKLKEPYSECEFENFEPLKGIYKEFFKNKIYSQNYCLEIESQVDLLRSCNCTNNKNFPALDDSMICKEKQSILCSVEYYNKKQLDNKVRKISENCPLECDSLDFETSVSTINFPTMSYVDFLLKNFSVFKKYWKSKREIVSNDVSKTISRLKIYYKNLGYEIKSEFATISGIKFISDIGGIAGLCLGFSMLTFCEFFEIFIEILKLIFRTSTYYV